MNKEQVNKIKKELLFLKQETQKYKKLFIQEEKANKEELAQLGKIVEQGHAFRLKHTDGHLKGKGQPGIMAARGTQVDEKYQYKPKEKVGELGSTINPTKRKVTKEDVLKVVKDLKFDKNGIANIGNASNKIFTKTGW